MSIRIIKQALRARLLQMPNVPPRANPNRKFQPEHDQIYIEPVVVPASADGINVSAGVLQAGIFRILIHAPLNDGDGPADEVAGNLISHFAEQERLIRDGVNVILRPGYQNEGFPVGDKFVVAVEIPFRSRYNR